jgi:alkyl sulfatase BDS1-like metallo-beta-lactamase superfamily hydrolase
VFDYLAVRLNAAKAAGLSMVVNWMLSDVSDSYRMNLSNSVLTARANRQG